MDMKAAVEVIETAQRDSTSVAQADVANAVDAVVSITADTYTRQSETYADVRETAPWSWDIHTTAELLSTVRQQIESGVLVKGDNSRWKLLDIGAGHGRDLLRFAEEQDVEPIGVDNSPGFISLLMNLQADGKIGPSAVVEADMRDLTGVQSESIDCVRNHATLHHLPVVPYGLGVDAAVAEAERVLKPGGVFYITVKSGDGIDIIDTGEGLDERFYQLFTLATLSDVLVRHGLSVVHHEENTEERNSGPVPWLFVLATK